MLAVRRKNQSPSIPLGSIEIPLNVHEDFACLARCLAVLATQNQVVRTHLHLASSEGGGFEHKHLTLAIAKRRSENSFAISNPLMSGCCLPWITAAAVRTVSL